MNPYERNVLGVGYRGKLSDGTIPKIVDGNGKVLREYAHWREMIRRCYDEKCLERKPSYRNVTIDSKCLEFAYFYEHFSEIEGYEEWKTHPELKWHLDKDIKQQGVENKIYSIETCKLVPMGENIKEMHDRNSRPVLGIHVNRDKYIIELSPQLVEDNYDIYSSNCINVINGREKSAGGYQWTYITKDEYNDIISNNYTIQELASIFNFADYINGNTVKVYCVEYPEIIFSNITEANEWCGGDVGKNIAGKNKSAGRHPETGERLHWKKCEE